MLPLNSFRKIYAGIWKDVRLLPDLIPYPIEPRNLSTNKVGVAAAILLVLTLLGGIVGTTWQAFAAKRERARAEKRFR